jgi:hypothetical protein
MALIICVSKRGLSSFSDRSVPSREDPFTERPYQGKDPKLFRVYCRYSPLCQNFAAETIGGCLRTASCKVGRLFDRNAEVEHRSLDECIGGDNQLKLA